ncbi:MAG: hypothetical protein LBC02_10270 [Planctomycetaceae bacterium]|jgi:hypothetical protein|nr:hypothetical protein [Planctomycetaceae bacterium]
MTTNDKYIEIFLEPLKKCKDYKPKVGECQNTKGVSLTQFLELYGSDAFYSWIGLDSSLMYAAHKAAGGMASVYRQIGIGCERLFREIIIDTTYYQNRDLAQWSYEIQTQNGKIKTLSLDGRLELNEIYNVELQKRLQNWMRTYCSNWSVRQIPQNGVVFGVRQGYKIKDGKRQNADIDNAAVAYSSGYLPVFAFFSSQIDSNIIRRYNNSRCGVIAGYVSDDPQISLFAFCKTILRYDLAAFFRNNSDKFKSEIHSILKMLLDAS